MPALLVSRRPLVVATPSRGAGTRRKERALAWRGPGGEAATSGGPQPPRSADPSPLAVAALYRDPLLLVRKPRAAAYLDKLGAFAENSTYVAYARSCPCPQRQRRHRQAAALLAVNGDRFWQPGPAASSLQPLHAGGGGRLRAPGRTETNIRAGRPLSFVGRRAGPVGL